MGLVKKLRDAVGCEQRLAGWGLDVGRVCPVETWAGVGDKNFHICYYVWHGQVDNHSHNNTNTSIY